MSVDFLHPDNVAGRTLLTLVARGSAIISELLRLSDHIPAVFTDPNSKYNAILIDFRYLKATELYDSRIDHDTELSDLDEEFRESHFVMLERFYQLVESVVRYIADFNTYIDELSSGVFVQHTVESVLEDVDGGQLMCECPYLYGVMLLIMDRRISGDVREKMIISYSRYKGSSINNLDEVVKLCRTTGYTRHGKRPANYPEEFYARLPLPAEMIMLLISRLRADDIYNHTSAYPAPQHRSMAYSAQASLIYILLYFAPNILLTKESIMREIVDKHFPDNWVIPYYMGFSVDLSDAWAPYKAASTALKNVLTKNNVETEARKHGNSVAQLNAELDKLLDEGVMNDEFVLSNPRKLVQTVRECNYSLRWLFLHRTTTLKPFRELIIKYSPINELMRLLMHTAQFEFLVKSILKNLLDTKEDRWNMCKRETIDRLNELSAYFSGEKELSRVKKDASLQAFFKSFATEVASLDSSNSIQVGRKLSTQIKSLENVAEFHQIDTSLQVKQFLGDCREYLSKMVRTININNKVLGDIDIISDFAYAWIILDDYTPLFHEKIKNDPASCLLLRSTFLKLASILNAPMVRITECDSEDDVSVADYYSTELVKYVRKVLEVIPQNVFKVLDEIINLQTNKLKQIPTKLERKYLADYAQLNERYTLARATHQVSVFTAGIVAMNTTLIGIIKLDPRLLLEDGIRKELVRQNATVMNEYLTFKTNKIEDFEIRLTELGRKLDGFRQSFEYIQDYIGLYGLKIWQEEISRIINYNVEQECNSFLRKKVYDWQSEYQSDAIPIPTFTPVIPTTKGVVQSVNFMGRLCREILLQTDVRLTVYVESLQSWMDSATGREVIGIKTFSLLHRGVGIFGLTGLDRLICFMIVKEVDNFIKMFRKIIIKPVEQFLIKFHTELTPLTQLLAAGDKQYDGAMTKTSKIWPLFLPTVTAIGQNQLIRRQIANELNFSAKLDSKILSTALETMNSALINDVTTHYARPDDKPYPGNPTLPQVSSYLETAGINNPLTKIYVTTETLEHVPLVIFLFVLHHLPLLTWNPLRSTLENKNKNLALDGAPLMIGVITILKQFHSVHQHTFIGYLGQYVRAHVSAVAINPTSSSSSSSAKGVPALPQNVCQVLIFLEEFCKFAHVSRQAIDSVIPSFIFDRFNHQNAV